MFEIFADWHKNAKNLIPAKIIIIPKSLKNVPVNKSHLKAHLGLPYQPLRQ